jgi:hypothetical protein
MRDGIDMNKPKTKQLPLTKGTKYVCVQAPQWLPLAEGVTYVLTNLNRSEAGFTPIKSHGKVCVSRRYIDEGWVVLMHESTHENSNPGGASLRQHSRTSRV